MRPLGLVTVNVSVRHWVAAPTSFMPPVQRNSLSKLISKMKRFVQQLPVFNEVNDKKYAFSQSVQSFIAL